MTDTQLRIFVVDDDREMRGSLKAFLDKAGCATQTFASGQAALNAIGEATPDVLVSDVRMPGMSGLELLDKVSAGELGLPVVLITAHGDVPMAVDAMKAGAFYLIEKPFQPDRLLDAIKRAAEFGRLRRENARLKKRLRSLSDLDTVLIGDSDDMRQLRQEIENIATTDAAVLILGETGTGKELVARALHDLSPRAGRPFIIANCATIPQRDFESHMFGAANGPMGLLSQADTGTLFFDELTAWPLKTQAKLLRLLETQEFTPVAGDQPKKVDIRVLSASNEALDERIDDRTFRKDLYYRLNSIIVNLPPLRERGDDLTLLYNHFAAKYAELYEIDAPEVTSADMAAMMIHEWPGNVRELRHVAERRILSARRGCGSVVEAIGATGDADDVPATLREAVAVFERQLIAQAIKSHQGRMDAVAEALGIGRRTLNEKIVKLGLNKEDLL